MRVSPIFAMILALTSLSLPACDMHRQESHQEVEPHEIVVTNPMSTSVTLTQPYVCQIHSQRHIQIRALETGYLQAITIKEGQFVKEGEPLFKVVPIIYEKKADAEIAEAKLAQLKYNYTKSLAEKKVVSENEVGLEAAKLAEAEAKADLAKAVLNFATVRAPFDGIVDRLHFQQGSLVQEGDILSTLSDNSVMWVYFNVPEARYLEYMAERKHHEEPPKIELMLADGSKFDQVGKISAIEADFNNSNGNIPFRADFPNPDGLLRNGQTGTVLISRVQKDAIVIPQRSTFEVLQKRYVYVVDKDDEAHQREIVVQNELEDVFLVKEGLSVNDKIVLEGTRWIHDGQKLKYEYRPPKEVFSKLKYHAE